MKLLHTLFFCLILLAFTACQGLAIISSSSSRHSPPVACVESLKDVHKYSGRRVIVRGKYEVQKKTPLQASIILKDGARVLLQTNFRKKEVQRFQGKKVRVSGYISPSQTASKGETSPPISGPYLSGMFPVYFFPHCSFGFFRDCPCKLKNNI